MSLRPDLEPVTCPECETDVIRDNVTDAPCSFCGMPLPGLCLRCDREKWDGADHLCDGCRFDVALARGYLP